MRKSDWKKRKHDKNVTETNLVPVSDGGPLQAFSEENANGTHAYGKVILSVEVPATKTVNTEHSYKECAEKFHKLFCSFVQNFLSVLKLMSNYHASLNESGKDTFRLFHDTYLSIVEASIKAKTLAQFYVTSEGILWNYYNEIIRKMTEEDADKKKTSERKEMLKDNVFFELDNVPFGLLGGNGISWDVALFFIWKNFKEKEEEEFYQWKAYRTALCLQTEKDWERQQILDEMEKVAFLGQRALYRSLLNDVTDHIYYLKSRSFAFVPWIFAGKNLNTIRKIVKTDFDALSDTYETFKYNFEGDAVGINPPKKSWEEYSQEVDVVSKISQYLTVLKAFLLISRMIYREVYGFDYGEGGFSNVDEGLKSIADFLSGKEDVIALEEKTAFLLPEKENS